MKNNEANAKEITERDEGALQYLKDIKWSRLEDAKGFKLEFFFDTNPYFSNSVLTKTYHMISEDEHILENAIGTEVEWFPGKSLTQKILKRKPKKGSNDMKPIIKTEECGSFFHFFDPPQLPEDAEEIDEETVSGFGGQQSEKRSFLMLCLGLLERLFPLTMKKKKKKEGEEDDDSDDEKEEYYVEENDEEEDDEEEDDENENQKENGNEKNVKNTNKGDGIAETSGQ